jgi:hypothetical protein
MNTINEDFMPLLEHFSALVDLMDPEDFAFYEKLKHVRVETCYRDRQMIVYEMEGSSPRQIDRLTFKDFQCDDQIGATSELYSELFDESLILGYEPQRIFGYEIYMFIPLDPKTRWAAGPSNPRAGSLSFPIVVRTRTRHSLRERGAQYCETGKSFGTEFNNSYPQ